MATVQETVASGIVPIVIDLSEVRFFEKNAKIYRSFIKVNSLDLGVLTHREYRFVARRTKVGDQLVRRHLEKLFRMIPSFLSENENIECFTIPVYARMLADSALASMLVDLLSLYPEIPPAKVCIELSADILYEDVKAAAEKIDELRALGVKVAICEVGDEFCPVFRLSELRFDYAFMDEYSTASLATEDAERIAGSLVKYLHYLDAIVIAPGLDTEARIESAKHLGADGYTADARENPFAERGETADG